MGRIGFVISGLVICGLMSGCSSGSPAAAAKTTTESVHIGRLTEIFATPLPANPAQASVVEGFRAATILWDKSQEDLELVSPVTADVTGPAITNLKDSLNAIISQQIVPAGTDRYFMTRVSMLEGNSATISTCDDGSKFKEVNPNTGVVDRAWNPTVSTAYGYVAWQMTRVGGHWAISGVTAESLPNSLAKPCQPLSAFCETIEAARRTQRYRGAAA